MNLQVFYANFLMGSTSLSELGPVKKYSGQLMAFESTSNVIR